MGSEAEPFRLLVTASRKFTDSSQMRIALFRLAPLDRPVLVVHGGAEGGDTLAKYWALEQKALGRDIDEEEHLADWDGPCQEDCDHGPRRKRKDGSDYCPAAGNYRNQDMVDLGADQALVGLVAGAKNKGTRDCLRRLRAAQIPWGLVIQRLPALVHLDPVEGRRSPSRPPFDVADRRAVVVGSERLVVQLGHQLDVP